MNNDFVTLDRNVVYLDPDVERLRKLVRIIGPSIQRERRHDGILKIPRALHNVRWAMHEVSLAYLEEWDLPFEDALADPGHAHLYLAHLRGACERGLEEKAYPARYVYPTLRSLFYCRHDCAPAEARRWARWAVCLDVDAGIIEALAGGRHAMEEWLDAL